MTTITIPEKCPKCGLSLSTNPQLGWSRYLLFFGILEIRCDQCSHALATIEIVTGEPRPSGEIYEQVINEAELRERSVLENGNVLDTIQWIRDRARELFNERNGK